MQKRVFILSGMNCSACVITIDGMLEDTEGILSAKTNYAKARVEVEFDERKISGNKIITIIKQAGYTASDA